MLSLFSITTGPSLVDLRIGDAAGCAVYYGQSQVNERHSTANLFSPLPRSFAAMRLRPVERPRLFLRSTGKIACATHTPNE